MKKAASIYGILVGISMIGMWTMLLATGQVTELNSEPYRITAHIISEFATAFLLIVSCSAVLVKKSWGRVLEYFSFGALGYSVLNAGGYYIDKGSSPMVVMFGCLLAATLFFVVGSVIGSKKQEKLC